MHTKILKITLKQKVAVPLGRQINRQQTDGQNNIYMCIHIYSDIQRYADK